MRAPAALIVCLTLAACGSDGDDDDGRQAAPGPQGASLTVIVQPKGPDGPSKRARIECERLGEGSEKCRSLARLTAEQLAPVPPDVACAERYGGPATTLTSNCTHQRAPFVPMSFPHSWPPAVRSQTI